MFRTVPPTIIRSFSLYTQQCYMSYRFADSLRAGSGRNRPDPARKLSANLYDTYHCCVYSKKTPDDDRRNCPKHVEFYSKNKFEQLVNLVRFSLRIFHDARSPDRQIRHEFRTRNTLTVEQYRTIGLDTRFKIDI